MWGGDAGIDYSDVSIKAVVVNIVNQVVPKCYTANFAGGFEAIGDEDSFGDSAPLVGVGRHCMWHVQVPICFVYLC